LAPLGIELRRVAIIGVCAFYIAHIFARHRSIEIYAFDMGRSELQGVVEIGRSIGRAMRL
jgi:hypothetical protein